MNVTGGNTKLLFCEGAPQSLDYRLLNALLIGKPPTTLVVPSGGKQGLRSFIRGRLAGDPHPPEYIGFRDRDFDAEPPPSVELIPLQQGKPIYLSHRAAVENYLLDVDLIHRYWNENATNSRHWRYGVSPGVDDLRSWMVEAANELVSYQASRWALAGLKPSERWPELGTTWTDGSGYLPASLSEDDCLAAAQDLVGEFLAETEGISKQNFSEIYRRYLAKFADPAFMEQDEYSIWFHGKDLKKAMQRLRPNAVSLDHFCGWAAENVDWKQHADLRQLAAAI